MNTKKQTKKSHLSALLPALLGIGLVACSPKEDTTTQASPDTSDLGSGLFLEQAPGGALNVAAARLQLSPGDDAVIEGQIGGVLEPFLSGYAGFVLADTKIVFCNEMGDDHCPTPWDACCEDADQLKARRISVQFVDADGHPLEGDLKGDGHLKELDHIVVIGIVAEGSTKENMIVHANKLAFIQ